MAAAKISTIFVVDDEQIIAETLAMILRQSGFIVNFFTSPLCALEEARIQAPDLLLTDVAMPELSGIDLAIQISQIYPTCKVLLFSGHAGTSDLLRKARELGYNFTLLVKPIYPQDLLQAISDSAETRLAS